MSKSFAASVFTVAGGSAVAQAIALAALPFITRLYPPEVYGAFVVFLAYGGIVGPVVCARFDVAIALPRRDRGAWAVAVGSLAVAAALATLTAFVVAGAAAVLHEPIAPVAWCLPVYVLLAGALQVFGNWSARIRDYGRLSMSRIVQAAATAVLAVGLVHAHRAEAAMLVMATVAGQVLALAVLLSGLPACGLGVRVLQVVRLLKHFRRIAMFNVPHVLSDVAQASGLPLMVAALFGTHAAAYYSFSIRLLKAPLGLVSGAISQVYYPRAAAHRTDNAKLRRDALRILAVLSGSALLALPVLFLIPHAAYGFAFGQAWGDVGAFLRALSPWILSSFVAAPLSVLYLVKERVGLDFALALAGSISAFAILAAASLVFEAVLLSMWALSIGMTVYVIATTVFEFTVVIGRSRQNV